MRFIPNEQSWVGFIAVLTGTVAAPKVADITSAIDLTKTIMGLTASTTGQAVPTPAFDSKFNRSIPGTVDATFSMDCYRFTTVLEDLAWATLPRGTTGFIIIARSGGIPSTLARHVEVWPIDVLARSVPNMTSNTPVSCTITASVPELADEDAIVAT